MNAGLQAEARATRRPYTVYRNPKNALVVVASPARAVADQAEIEEHGDNERDQIQPFHRMMRVDDPRIHDGGHRKKNKSDEDEHQRMVGSFKKIREQVQQDNRDSRECESQQQ